jgi:hypothetical protein
MPSKDAPKPTSLSASAANSKSTPNLSALSTSAPAQDLPRKPVAKGPLVRQTPATPLDAAPQPKRRRATIVEGTAAKPSPLSLTKKTGSQSPTTSSPVTASPAQSTRGPAQAVRKVLPRVSAPLAPPPPPAPAPVLAPAVIAPAPSPAPQKRATRASLGNIGMAQAKVSTK